MTRPMGSRTWMRTNTQACGAALKMLSAGSRNGGENGSRTYVPSTTSVSVTLADPLVLVAVTVTAYAPALLGVPAIRYPASGDPCSERPGGSPVAVSTGAGKP